MGFTSDILNSASKSTSSISSGTLSKLAKVGVGLDVLSLGWDFYNGIENIKAQKEANKIAWANLDETKEQNAYEREKYETTLANQQSGVDALASVFGSSSSTTDSTSTDSTTPSDTSTSASTDALSGSINSSALDSSSQNNSASLSQTSELPTERL